MHCPDYIKTSYFSSVRLELWCFIVVYCKNMRLQSCDCPCVNEFAMTKIKMHHCPDDMISTMASQIIDVTSVYSTVCSGADQGKYQSSASLAFVRGIHQWPVNSPHKGPVTQKMFPFDDVIIINKNICEDRSNVIAISRRHFKMLFVYTLSQLDSNFNEICHQSPVNHMSTMVRTMVWRRSGDKLLSEAMTVW